MALTPEDVVNKRFNPTKFREGYDQDEVDDFLDEVVVELRRLNQENEELRQRLVQGDARIAELQRAGAQAAAAPAEVAAVAPAPVPEPAPAFAPAPASELSAADAGNTNNLLQLARRLHEEHVREGMEKRDSLVAEGHAAAARVVSEAEQVAREKLAELERAGREQIASLDQERVGLERQVEELRIFEREYRSKLKGYIEGQLRELDDVNALASGPAAGGAVAAPVEPVADSAPQAEQPAAEPVAAEPVTAEPAAEAAPAEPVAAEQAPAEPAAAEPVAAEPEAAVPAEPERAPAPAQQTVPQQAAAPQAAPQYAAAPPQAAPAYNGPQSTDQAAYPQPTEYPGFASGN